jgi:hypothetical protein
MRQQTIGGNFIPILQSYLTSMEEVSTARIFDDRQSTNKNL